MSSSPGSMDDGQRNSLELDSEPAQRIPGAEQAQGPPTQAKPKERQKFFEEAFQQDMEQYLSTGYLQITERREPIGSMSSMEVNVDMMEQMDLTDVSEHESMDVFLLSGGEDTSATSPGLGSEAESFTTEISLQVPTQAELRHKLCSSSSSSSSSSLSPRTDPTGQEDLEGAGEGARRDVAAAVTPGEDKVHSDALLGTRKDREQTSS